MTLLEIAKSFKCKNRYGDPITNEVIEVALAWLRNEISAAQVRKALNVKPGLERAYLSRVLKEAYLRGALKEAA